MSDIEGKVAREAISECGQRASFNGASWESSDIHGQTERSNGAFGESDIEGKVARVAARKRGRDRVSNETERMSQHFWRFRDGPALPFLITRHDE